MADEKALFDDAKKLFKGDDTSREALREIRQILDRIVADYPSSDLAAQILFEDSIDGLNIRDIDRSLSALTSTSAVSAPESAVESDPKETQDTLAGPAAYDTSPAEASEKTAMPQSNGAEADRPDVDAAVNAKSDDQTSVQFPVVELRDETVEDSSPGEDTSGRIGPVALPDSALFTPQTISAADKPKPARSASVAAPGARDVLRPDSVTTRADVKQDPAKPATAFPVINLDRDAVEDGPISESEMFSRAKELAESTSPPFDSTEANNMRAAYAILDRIVAEFPSSDLAVRILLGDNIDGLDVSKLQSDVEKLPPLDSADPRHENLDSLVSNPVEPLRNEEITMVAPPMIAEGNELPATIPLAPEPGRAPNPTSPEPSNVTSIGSMPNIGLERVRECLIRRNHNFGDNEIILEVQIDAGGSVSSLPELVSPTRPTPDERALFIASISALDECAPYGSGLTGRHRLRISSDAVRLVSSEAPSSYRRASQDINGALAAQDPGATWLPATELTDKDLNLSRRQIAELQARLTVLGFDPRGIDGVVGSGTRAAISEWQSMSAIPSTGFLDRPQLELLRQKSEPVFVSWISEIANQELVDNASVEPAPSKNSSKKRSSLPPGYFWYKGRMCRKVFGDAVYACK